MLLYQSSQARLIVNIPHTAFSEAEILTLSVNKITETEI